MNISQLTYVYTSVIDCSGLIFVDCISERHCEFVAYKPHFEHHHFDAKSYQNQFLSGCYLLQRCIWFKNLHESEVSIKNKTKTKRNVYLMKSV